MHQQAPHGPVRDVAPVPDPVVAAVGAAPWERGIELAALGRAVRELRARRALSQEALGFKSGLHRNYVGAVERGEINATFRVLLKLSRGLQLSLAELVDVYERHRAC